jgi:hypothetical protein
LSWSWRSIKLLLLHLVGVPYLLYLHVPLSSTAGNISIFRSTMCFNAFCGHQHRQRLKSYTSFTDLFFIAELECVYCAVRNGSLNIIQTKFFPQSFNVDVCCGWRVANGWNDKTQRDMIMNFKKVCQCSGRSNRMLFWPADKMKSKDTSWSWCQRNTGCLKDN